MIYCRTNHCENRPDDSETFHKTERSIFLQTLAKKTQRKRFLSAEKKRVFRRLLLGWYRVHRRTLPWRGIRDPYGILVSEIMLQQTQVDRVIPKYLDFLKRFPTISALARASRADVIRAWSGLGYNRRAIHLHKAAQIIRKEYKGRIPQDAECLRSLPGIGPYTANAILSFSFHRRVAAVDTNQQRVVGRFFVGVQAKQKAVERISSELIPQEHGDVWNHALMDFGALVCRSSPRCAECPLRQGCRAYPAVLKPRKQKRSAERFFGSDRYIRGRIIEKLRQMKKGKMLSYEMLISELRALPSFRSARINRVLRGLGEEGFLESRGAGKRTLFCLAAG